MTHQTPVRRAVARREAPAHGAAVAAAARAASYSGSMPARGPSEGSPSPWPPDAGRRCTGDGQSYVMLHLVRHTSYTRSFLGF